MYREWLVDGLNKTNKTQADLAKETGIAHSVINRMVLGKRAIRDHEIVTISKALGILPPVGPKGRTSANALPASVELIPVVAVAQDGVWREQAEPATRPAAQEIVAASSVFYAGTRRSVQLVDPIDGAPDIEKQYLIFVPIEHLERNLRDRDRVYAEISRDKFVQHTVLRAQIAPGKQMLFSSITGAIRTWKANQVKPIGLVTGMIVDYRV